MMWPPVSASIDDGSSTITCFSPVYGGGWISPVMGESRFRIGAAASGARRSASPARGSRDSCADTGGKREQQRRRGDEYEQWREQRGAERSAHDRRPLDGRNVALEGGARERSVECGDERVSELGDALLEPERHGGERAHSATVPEGVGGGCDR